MEKYSLAIAPDGTPYVVYNPFIPEPAPLGSFPIYARRWNGTSWENVGAGGIVDSWGDRPSLAIAPDGTPYVAWEEGTHSHGYNSEIYVRRFNGSSWEEVGTGSGSGGGISDNQGDSYDSSIAIAPDGTPYVAWKDDNNAVDDDIDEIYVRRFNGSSWEEVGTGSASGDGISGSGEDSLAPSIAIAPDGTPYIAWQEEDSYSGDFRLYIRRYNGSSWEEVGAGSASGSGLSEGYAWGPTLAVSPNGTPYVAWAQDSPRDIHVFHWNGNSWNESNVSDTGDISNTPSLAIASDGTPYIAWAELRSPHQVYVRGKSSIQATPTKVVFFAEESGANPAPRDILVDSPVGTITCTATLSPTVSWLSISPISDTTPTTFTVDIDTTGLGIGQYTTQVVISGGEYPDPQIIDVSLVVAEEIYTLWLPLALKD
jgi:hypothetical protein